MSASLFATIPFMLLLIVFVFCFTGCAQIVGIDQYQPATDYEQTVISTPGLVAYWPLVETTGTVAFDADPTQSFTGVYTQAPSAIYDSANESAAATGAVNLGQPGIVPGDADSNSTPSPCPFFDGGFVNVPWSAALNPTAPFTLEAWVRPNWTADDVQNFPAIRAVAVSFSGAANSGWALSATPDNFWAATVGIGSSQVSARPPVGSNQTIVLETTHFLVMTYDGATLTLWVNPAETSSGPYAEVAVSGFVPTPPPTPVFIGKGRADLPNGLLPFNGFIQDVAFYNVVLDNNTIETHFMKGNGIQKT